MSEAHLVSSQSSSGAVCSVNSAFSGLKVLLFAGWQEQRWKRGLASGTLPNGVRKVIGIAPLAAQGTATVGAAAMPGDMGGRLGLDDAPLQVAEQGLALAERQADCLDPLVGPSPG